VTVEPRDLVAHLVPEITEGRLARQWASIDSKVPRAARASPRVWRMTALSLTAAGLCAWLWWRPAQLPGSGAVVESSDTPVAMQLRDGSSVELAAQTRLRVLRDQPTGVEVELAEGRASFDVTHVDQRSFTVRAGNVAVHVIGTKFDVLRVSRPEGTEVSVSVERGVVAVERADRGDQRRLTVGEKWSVWIPAEPAADAPAVPSQRVDASQPAAQPKPATGERSRRQHDEDASNRRSRGALHARAERSANTAAAKPEDARELFSRALIARRAGMVEEAADAYAELLHRYPRDTRAAMSAFELGRIRMDALDDARGAADAFRDALRIARKAQFREDALARLAIASDSLGDLDDCRKARESYLSEYPNGVHVSALSALCGDRL
jgi:TolA-binding protein